MLEIVTTNLDDNWVYISEDRGSKESCNRKGLGGMLEGSHSERARK